MPGSSYTHLNGTIELIEKRILIIKYCISLHNLFYASTITLIAMEKDRGSFFARNMTHDEISRRGAVANLNDGLEVSIHGISTRLLAWPGTGFKMESVHVLTLQPGDESEMYEYAVSEEAMLCLKGKGQVFIHDQWTRGYHKISFI